MQFARIKARLRLSTTQQQLNLKCADLKHVLRAWDANGDGNLSLQELIEAAGKTAKLKKASILLVVY